MSTSIFPPTPSPKHTYLIIGAGVFGVSTALHLIRRYPTASVTLLDRDAYDATTRVAASWDWNKVVRADYDDLIYCRLGLEAQDIFRSDPLWKPYFHETGIFWICRSDYAQEVMDNYKKLGREADLKAVPIEEARKLYGGMFDDADYNGVKEVLVNKTSGWAAAGDCLRAVTKEALRLGVEYIVADVAALEFNEAKTRCTGVRTTNGQIVTATHTILSTGAFTPKLLEQSAARSGINGLRAGSRILAAGITTGMTKLDKDIHDSIYAKMPVGVQGYNAELGPFIGSLPPTPDREIKWWGQTIFTNTTEVLPGRYLSAPPNAPDYAQWKVPQELKSDIDHANKVFYGKRGENWKMEKYRICWDAFTTSADFIISPHTSWTSPSSPSTPIPSSSSITPLSTSYSSNGLYIATCGNFHGWKFFPVLGKYVVKMLEGDLEPELANKWAWDRERPDGGMNPDWPRWEASGVLNQERPRL
ncbi:uncharacterized protein MYCGRDRAFT_109694 [Zymoseptoria tritici IPO323]|uniref:FAD dependent oxidoreductase domain-containing protein n=1 Tax=Zymoseptoria tritici (strain CBS 115943 / IPO323) TaxID=336722 RepID=F9XBJ5_ZYMTI|nr:uncharacterized protein MYCGRDRAFT_109694 [Zymoseptoria tritici IPO323]EGP87389.1 hypothetical protein MYCGRDRAFT_109694 [Zymoseptoria tritici IPO323]